MDTNQQNPQEIPTSDIFQSNTQGILQTNIENNQQIQQGVPLQAGINTNYAFDNADQVNASFGNANQANASFGNSNQANVPLGNYDQASGPVPAPSLQQNSSKKKIIIPLIILAIVAAVAIGTYFMFFTPEKRIARNLSLGNQYLKEQKYDDAIVAYNAVINIDKKQIKAYEGLLTANKELKAYDKAIDSMETAITVIGQDEIPQEDITDLVDVYKLGADEAESNDDVETAEKYWTRVAELAPDDADAAAKNQYYEVYNDLHSEEYMTSLDNIVKGAKAEDWDTVYGEMASESFQSLLQKISDYGITDKFIVDTADGKIGIYEGGFIYVGDFNGDIREGNGVWLNYDSDGDYRYYAKGPWSNDLPNGQFDEMYYRTTPLEGYALRVEYAGNITNGLWDGTMVCTWTDNDGSVSVYNVPISNGELQDYEIGENGGYSYKAVDSGEYDYSRLTIGSISGNGIAGVSQTDDIDSE